jgi:hypothetical protein
MFLEVLVLKRFLVSLVDKVNEYIVLLNGTVLKVRVMYVLVLDMYVSTCYL